MVWAKGIEPSTSAWKADILPLNYAHGIEWQENLHYTFTVIQEGGTNLVNHTSPPAW